MKKFAQLDLEKGIQVYNKGNWYNAEIINVFESETEYGMLIMKFEASLVNGDTVIISNIVNEENLRWRYKENDCSQCVYHDVEGGDSVPHGMGSAYLPEYDVCNCSDIDEDIDDPCSKYCGNCPHYKSNGVGYSTDKLYYVCNKYKFFTYGTSRQYNKLFGMAMSGSSVRDLAVVIALCSEDVTVEYVRQVLIDELE